MDKIISALVNAQKSFKTVGCDKNNPHFKSRYASLDAINDMIRQPLADNGLAVVSRPFSRDGRMMLEVKLVHTSGEMIASELDLGVDGTSPQKLGSALSYMRRYGICCLLNITWGEDDDAEAAEDRGEQKQYECITDKQVETIRSLRQNSPAKDQIDALLKEAIEAHKVEGVSKLPKTAGTQLLSEIFKIINKKAAVNIA